jgi:hypothetical protein
MDRSFLLVNGSPWTFQSLWDETRGSVAGVLVVWIQLLPWDGTWRAYSAQSSPGLRGGGVARRFRLRTSVSADISEPISELISELLRCSEIGKRIAGLIGCPQGFVVGRPAVRPTLPQPPA